ncbi:hypothetical protein K7432_007173 [Basidiobolus ranarum]|uniref:FAR1 domain-containing protein n=1 Tax=Basidiobolus ranarum TaxID=34480 RepID=A0ABR2W0H1_9FUNG
MDFDNIFNTQFLSPKEAFDYCQQLARSCGFGIRRRTSKDSTIYIVCSREGRSEYKGTTFRVRNRVSERCNCDWRVVLFLSKRKLWEFKAGKCMNHNHPLAQHEDYPKKRPKLEGSALNLEKLNSKNEEAPLKINHSIPNSPPFHRTPPPSPPETDSHLILSIAPNRGPHRFPEYTRLIGCISGRNHYPSTNTQSSFRQLLPSSRNSRICPRFPPPQSPPLCIQHNGENTLSSQDNQENHDPSRNEKDPGKGVQKAALQFILN